MKRNCRTIAVANQKGGVAKTTTVNNLGHALAQQGYKVLLVDADPQASLTRSLGVEDPDDIQVSIADLLEFVIKDVPFERSQGICKATTLDFIASLPTLASTEVWLQTEDGGGKALDVLLQVYKDDYDYIIIDTNPSLSLLLRSALAAADEVLIPVNMEYWAAVGLSELVGSIARSKRFNNPTLKITGLVLTMCSPREIAYSEVKAMLKEFCGDDIRVFESEIPRTTAISKANLSSRSIVDVDPSSKAAQAYIALAKELCEVFL